MLNECINLLYVVSGFYLLFYISTVPQGPDININKTDTGNKYIINDNDLQTVTEKLFNESPHELYRYVSIKYQGHATSKNSTDNAPERLLNVSSEVFSNTIIKSLVKLFDNYEMDTYQPEIITDEEDAEENEFIDNLLSTNNMIYTMDYLSDRGFFENDLKVYKEVLKDIWFHQYSRTKGINGSSGFEHVFMVERKPRKGIIGLHNWIFFFLNELEKRIDYFGFLRDIEFVEKAAIAQVHFTYHGKHKTSTMFIGTTPELEMSLYTLCFFARPNKKCKISFAGRSFGIQTYISRNNDKKLIGTAFPLI